MVKNKQVNKKQPAKTGKTSSRNETKVPVANNIKVRSRNPGLNSTAIGTKVSHKEICIESLTNSVDFSLNSIFAIQPGISEYSRGSPLGTWIPSLAKGYDYYKFDTLKFHFIPTCSTLTSGQVIFTYDPNPEANPPSSFSSALNAFSIAGPVRDRVTLDLSSKVKGRRLMVRTGIVQSFPLYDAGRLFVFMNAGGDSTSKVGYVQVEYTLTLDTPQTNPGIPTSEIIDGIPTAQYFSGTSVATNTTWYAGTVNATRRPDIANALCLSQSTKMLGESLVTPASISLTAGNYTLQDSNIVLGVGVTGSYNGFTVNESGCYRIRYGFAGDFQDMAIYGTTLAYVKTVGSNLVPTRALRAAQKFDGTYTTFPVLWNGMRGFSTVSAGPTDDDLVCTLDIEALLIKGVSYFLALGTRSNGTISENQQASFINNIGNGLPFCEITYLATCPTPLLTAYA